MVRNTHSLFLSDGPIGAHILVAGLINFSPPHLALPALQGERFNSTNLPAKFLALPPRYLIDIIMISHFKGA